MQLWKERLKHKYYEDRIIVIGYIVMLVLVYIYVFLAHTEKFIDYVVSS